MPLDVSSKLKAVPTVAATVLALVMTGAVADELIVSVKVALVALIAALKNPACVGVPAMAPVVGFSASPGGSAPAVTAKPVGELLAATANVNGTPTRPEAAAWS